MLVVALAASGLGLLTEGLSTHSVGIGSNVVLALEQYAEAEPERDGFVEVVHRVERLGGLGLGGALGAGGCARRHGAGCCLR